MSKRIKRFILPVIGICAIAGYVFYAAHQRSDLRTVLAESLNLPEDRKSFLFLNIPARPGYYPGSIFSRLGPPYSRTAKDSDDLVWGPRAALRTSRRLDSRLTPSVATQLFGGQIGLRETGGVRLEVHDLVVVTMDAKRLRERILESDRSLDLFNRGIDPLVVSTAYVGRIGLAVTGEQAVLSKLSADMSKRRKSDRAEKFKLSAKLEVSGETALRIITPDPVVFAFEAVSAKLLTTHLGPRPNAVEFRPVEAFDVPD